MATQEDSAKYGTPPAGRKKLDAVSTRVTAYILAALVLLGLIAVIAGTSSSSPAPLLLGESAPTRVSIPSISAASSLIPLGQKKDGRLEVPPLSTPQQASWYDRSPSPGEVGPAVILGHVDGNGKPGVFVDLDKLQPGQEVMIDRADGQTAVFTVSRVGVFPKNDFPAPLVYNDTADSELRLITCGGELDREAHSYLSNVVVFANLTSVRSTA